MADKELDRLVRAMERIASSFERLVRHFAPEVPMPKVDEMSDEQLRRAYDDEMRIWQDEQKKKPWKERYGL